MPAENNLSQADDDVLSLLELAESLVPEEGENSTQASEALADKLNTKDRDIIESFVDEAVDLSNAIQSALDILRDDTGADKEALYRNLHTLKGSTRTMGARRLGQKIHDIEGAFKLAENRTNSGFLAVVDECEQMLADTIAFVETCQGSAYSSPVSRPEGEGPDVSLSSGSSPPKDDERIRVGVNAIGVISDATDSSRLMALSLRRGLERQRDNSQSLAEATKIISRALRSLDIYSEAQIQHSLVADRGSANIGDDFDPLEMDRYTKLQDLSRSLNEAAEDVLEIQRAIERRSGDNESVLTSLLGAFDPVTEGLHQIRLTPVYDYMYEKLKGVVRRTSKDVGKSVHLYMDPSEVALDRLLLDKIIPPMNHIIRNSIDHGIEDAETRKKTGKPDIGRIEVEVKQHAAQAVVTVTDDGSGLDVPAVRNKAIEKGMWDASEQMTDDDAATMICQPGFSTSESVTSVSGRGVGMDVVRSSILKMGGGIKIETTPGIGTKTTISLPTSASTSAVLMLYTSMGKIVIPLNVIEDISSYGRDDIVIKGGGLFAPVRAQGPGEPVVEKKMRYDNYIDMSTAHPENVLGPSRRRVTIVWAVEGNRRVALRVDEVGEIMDVPLYKADGLIGEASGVVGATVLPDGDTSVLLDPLRVKLSDVIDKHDGGEANRSLIMVVDDSITIRKIMNEFLQKNGFNVVLAKDGREAIQILSAGATPKLVLLDVEMPNMNGFDCAKSIRQRSTASELPIIMVTSRTADKHKDRALEIGVQEYIGKPFDEANLLSLISKHAPG